MPKKSNNFKVHEIRPDNLSEGQQMAVDKDIDFLLSHSGEFVSVDCPACNGKSKKKKLEKRGFQYVVCLDCQTMYLNPRPSQKLLEQFYQISENYTYWNNFIFPATKNVRREKIFKPRVDTVLNHVKTHAINTSSILEVGAGFGFFCLEMSERGVFERLVGVEPTPDLANTCRQQGIDVVEETIEKFADTTNERFDLIVNFEVIEHLFSPREFVKSCQKLLKPDGFFIMTCPNGQGFDVLVLEEESDTIDHEHMNYFNPSSIKILLEGEGFSVVDLTTPGQLDVDLVYQKFLTGSKKLQSCHFIEHVFTKLHDGIGEKLQTFITNNNLSSNMMVVAKKIV